MRPLRGHPTIQNQRALVTGGAGFIGSNLANRLAADNELTGVYNVGTDVDPEYIECPFEGYVLDTIADHSNFHDATGWDPEISFEEGVELVCEPT